MRGILQENGSLPGLWFVAFILRLLPARSMSAPVRLQLFRDQLLDKYFAFMRADLFGNGSAR
jgi:hypothetical protein